MKSKIFLFLLSFFILYSCKVVDVSTLESTKGTGKSVSFDAFSPAMILPPGNIEQVSGSLDSVTIKWESVVSAVSYNIYRSDKIEGNYELVGNSELTEFTDIIAPELKSKIFYYHIKCVDLKKQESFPSKTLIGVYLIPHLILVLKV